MAEFAIVAPVLILLIVGLLVFGRLFYYWIEANQVATETARWAAVDRNPYAPNGDTLQTHAQGGATVEFENKAQVCIEFPDGTPPRVGQRVRVQVAVPASFAGLFSLGVTLNGASTMRIERFANGTSPVNYTATCAT